MASDPRMIMRTLMIAASMYRSRSSAGVSSSAIPVVNRMATVESAASRGWPSGTPRLSASQTRNSARSCDIVTSSCYEANGSHPTPGRDRVDFAAMARAAGYREAFEFDGLNSFSAALRNADCRDRLSCRIIRDMPWLPKI